MYDILCSCGKKWQALCMIFVLLVILQPLVVSKYDIIESRTPSSFSGNNNKNVLIVFEVYCKLAVRYYVKTKTALYNIYLKF